MTNKENENANSRHKPKEQKASSNNNRCGSTNDNSQCSAHLAAMIMDAKAAIKAELKEEVKVEVKEEVKEEIKAELKKELGGVDFGRKEKADDLRRRQKERGGYDSAEILECDKQNILQKVEK
jgi:hypothetical protein